MRGGSRRITGGKSSICSKSAHKVPGTFQVEILKVNKGKAESKHKFKRKFNGHVTPISAIAPIFARGYCS
jgi:hypothetical protein